MDDRPRVHGQLSMTVWTVVHAHMDKYFCREIARIITSYHSGFAL